MDPKAEQSPQSQDHCDLSRGGKHRGSGPSPSQSPLGSMWLLVAPPYQRKVGWAEIFPHSLQDLTNTINSDFQVLSPSDCQYSFESWRRRLELCVGSGGVLWWNVNVVGKSDRYFLFCWPLDITKWTAFVLHLSQKILLFLQRLSFGSKSTIPWNHTVALILWNSTVLGCVFFFFLCVFFSV